MKINLRSYTKEFRVNVVKSAKEVGASAAARELKIPTDTLYTWMARAKRGDLSLCSESAEAKSALNMTERVKELEREIKMLRRENQILEAQQLFLPHAVRSRKKSEIQIHT